MSPADPRTIAVGDIHGEIGHLDTLLGRLPELRAEDTLLFLGDYVDRGPASAEVIHRLRHELPRRTPARIVTLRGNHEDAWLKVADGGWSAFVLPTGNGCLATLRAFTGGPVPEPGAFPSSMDEMDALISGSFLPAEVLAWLRALPHFHEDEHAIYVHGGLPTTHEGWRHPANMADPTELLWCRDARFVTDYRGKRVVFGHTPTQRLPQHLSSHTPEDSTDLCLAGDLVGLDTGCGRGGFLSAMEFPSLRVYESR